MNLKKGLVGALIFVFLFISLATNVGATYRPTSVRNNHFGIHITDSNDLEDAAALVNGGGGDWGYVTLVIQKGERDTERWTRVFKQLRELHLIPIVRIATKPILSFWEKPNVDEVDGWTSFLNSLPWPTKNRYVIVGNEVNHAEEWGGSLKPEEYVNYFEVFSSKLKKESDKFYIMAAAFDSSAPNGFLSMDEEKYIREMLLTDPNFYTHVDGWASHSYPNPGFIGSETDTGRRSIKSYEWELDLLKSLGVERDFDVFITETGWAHNVEGEVGGNIDPNLIGKKFEYAYNTVWNDKRIVAVTPFIINYNAWPFDVFSWKDKTGNFYPFYYEVMNMQKKEGTPILEPTPTLVPSPSPSPMPAPTPEATPAPPKGVFDIIGNFFSKIGAFLVQLTGKN